MNSGALVVDPVTRWFWESVVVLPSQKPVEPLLDVNYRKRKTTRIIMLQLLVNTTIVIMSHLITDIKANILEYYLMYFKRKYFNISTILE